MPAHSHASPISSHSRRAYPISSHSRRAAPRAGEAADYPALRTVWTAALIAVLAACGDASETAGPDAPGRGADAGDGGGESEIDAPSHLSRAVVAALDSPELSRWEDRLWRVSADVRLPEDWIFETPPAATFGAPLDSLEVVSPCDAETASCDADFRRLECSGDSDCVEGGRCEEIASTRAAPEEGSRSLCVGDVHPAYERFYDLVVEADERVDIASLSPPDGPFLAALRNAITYLDRAGREVEVRLHFGSIILDEFDVGEVTAELARDLADGGDTALSVGTYREGYDSWNHAKIAAIDGEAAIVGGMNLLSASYLRREPVFDLSMEIAGAPAADAHRFTDELWRYTCRAEHVGETGLTDYATTRADGACPDDVAPAQSSAGGDGSTWIASLGRLGDIGADAADRAIVEALFSARESIALSVQDLGPLQFGPVESYAWPSRVLDALARAAATGVEVDVLMTNPVDGGGSGGEAYSNGWTPRDVIDRVHERLRLRDDWLAEGDTAADALCDNLRVATLRPFDERTWPGDEPFANHAKSFILDERAFYIGSQNLYPADLAEFGYFVDDAEAAGALLERYWDPLWSSSTREIDNACDGLG